jgi:cytidine deaminase
MSTLTAEDEKLVVLARATRQRAGAAEGAAVRDGSGRTYAGATASFADPALDVSALRVALTLAMTSGVRALEVAVVVTEAATLSSDGPAALETLSPGTPVHLVAP